MDEGHEEGGEGGEKQVHDVSSLSSTFVLKGRHIAEDKEQREWENGEEESFLQQKEEL